MFGLTRRTRFLKSLSCLITSTNHLSIKERTALIGQSAIGSVVKHIVQDVDEKVVVAVVCPGPGFLLKELARAGVPKLFGLYESPSSYLDELENLQRLYPNQIKTIECQFLYTPEDSNVITVNGKLIKSMLDLPTDFTTFEWKEKPRLKCIVTLTPSMEKHFLFRLHKYLALREEVFALGRVEFLMLISSVVGKYLLRQTKTRGRFLYNANCYSIFYDLKFLDQYDWDNFYPKPLMPKSYKKSNVYLLSITPKASLSDQLDPKHWPDAFAFIRLLAYKLDFIIPLMEKLIPNSGIKIVKLGFPIFKKCKDLEPDEIFQLYIEISKWPEYSNSPLAELLAESSLSTAFLESDHDPDNEQSSTLPL